MVERGATLTFCHNVKDSHSAAPDKGHVWLVIKERDQVSTYGLWPGDGDVDSRLQSLIRIGGWDHSGTHVQKDIEQHWKFSRRYFTPTWARSWQLDQAKTAQLHALIQRPRHYSSADNNCADWAIGIVSTLVGVDFAAKKEFAPTRGFAGRIADPTQGTMISAPRLLERSVLRLDWRDNMLMGTKPVAALAAEPMLPEAPMTESGKARILPAFTAPLLVGGLLAKKAGLATLLS